MTETLVNGNGEVIANNTGLISYSLVNGKVVIDLGDGTLVSNVLISKDTVHWYIKTYSHNEPFSYYENWLLSELEGFPLL